MIPLLLGSFQKGMAFAIGALTAEPKLGEDTLWRQNRYVLIYLNDETVPCMTGNSKSLVPAGLLQIQIKAPALDKASRFMENLKNRSS